MKSMAWVGAVVVVVAGVSACTSPNPRSCQDGLCTDQAYPFCDVDGSVAGSPETCIAVSCTAGDIAGCRGDLALTCNATGNDYDQVMCSLGCSVDGCVTCSSNAQCDNPTPVCEAGQGCRGCSSDAECDSNVCDLGSGACVAESEVLYASPTGAATASCTKAAPCSLTQAVTLASGNALRSNVHLATGTYASAVELAAGTVHLIGNGATIIGPAASGASGVLNIGRGATVSARDLRLDLSRFEVYCGGVGASGLFVLGGKLRLDNVTIDTPQERGVFLLNGCLATFNSVSLTVPATGFTNVFVVGNVPGNTETTRVELDRFKMVSTTSSTPVFKSSAPSIVTITNSVFDSVYVDLGAGAVIFSSIVTQGAIGLVARAGSRVENTIVVGAGTDAVVCNSCSADHNVFFPQAMSVIGTNTVSDPQFVDRNNKDYRLKPTSPAINAAVPSNGLDTDHDYAGTLRPQGAAKDIGAFELVP